MDIVNKEKKASKIDQRLNELLLFFKKKVKFSFKFLIKDIDISARDFILLFLNSTSFLLLFEIQIVLTIVEIGVAPSINYAWISLPLGIFIGLIISFFISDKIQKPLLFLRNLLLGSFILNLIQLPLIFFNFVLFGTIISFIDITILIIAIITYVRLTLYKTTILERGRVMAYIFASTFLVLVFALSSLIYGIILIFPISFVIITLIILHKNKDAIKISPQRTDTPDAKKNFQLDLFKYCLFFGFFSLTAGLATPLESAIILIQKAFAGNIILIISVIILFILISSILLGIIFDFLGRKATLSFIILAIAIATYISIFQVADIDIPIAVIYSALIAGIYAAPLLIGDSIVREKFGKSLSLAFLILLTGLVVGMLIRIYVFYVFLISNEKVAEQLLFGNVFLSSIVCFMLLTKETLPSKEQNWKSFLIRLFIIHESGILLFENSYLEEGDAIEPDLISGGIVGLINILKEIVRGESKVRTIDHGDRKLMFTSNVTNDIIFVLIVRDELVIIRNKLAEIAEQFDAKFYNKINDIRDYGVNMDEFKEIKNIVKFYFGKLEK